MPTSTPLSPAASARIDEAVTRLLNHAADPAGAVSIWLADLDGDVAYARESEAVHYAASTMKVPLAVATYRRHERGDLSLDSSVDVHNTFASAADGSPFSLDQAEDQDDDTWAALGASVPMRTLVERSLSQSSNLATNLVLDAVGAGAVAEVLSDAGCSPDTVVVRGIEDLVAAEGGLRNMVTAEDLGLVLRGVADRSLASADSCQEIESMLTRQQFRDGIPAGLPGSAYVANKTGQVDGLAHDMALVRPDDRPAYLLVVLTTVQVPDPEAQALIAEVSRAVWEGWHA